ncbi:MRG domain-containing protein [Aphelenchoides fujianensis]|nr:MRG domain-containing protein [Aphelenchoides fujianensis]
MPSSRKTGESPAQPVAQTEGGGRRSKASAAAAQPAERPAAPAVEYKVKDRILCLHQGNFFYDANIIAESTNSDGERCFKVHYNGWNKRHDETIPIGEVGRRFKPWSVDAMEEAESSVREAKQSVGKKKKSTAPDVSGTPVTTTSSRSSTPNVNKRQARGSVAEGVPPAKRGRRTGATPSGTTQSPKESTAFGPLGQLPAVFCTILKTDREMILAGRHTRNKWARTPGPEQVHAEYNSGENMTTSPTLLLLTVEGLRDYFNCCLRAFLLYKDEWATYDKRRAQDSALQDTANSDSYPIFNAAAHYGVVHLVRMLSKLNFLHEQVMLAPGTRAAVEAHVFDFTKFLEKQIDHYYNAEEEYLAGDQPGTSA